MPSDTCFKRGSYEVRTLHRGISLSSTGTFPGGLITLAPPILEDEYCAELIGQRNFPPTDQKLFVAWSIVCEMFFAQVDAVHTIAGPPSRRPLRG
jgi:hypothetical protein